MSLMSWEEIIVQIRKDPDYKELVELAYFDANLSLNVERFRASEEYLETLQLLKKFGVGDKARILDLGAGNGIAAVAFAIDGFTVTAVEPDPSDTIGAGAIRKLKLHYGLTNLDVVEAWGESQPFEDASFDVVYVRQAVHHARDLDSFIKEAARLIVSGGIVFTCRDHVIFDDSDKEWFLSSHPLHKYYGGENAYTEVEYDRAFHNAQLHVELKLQHYDSVINYFPERKEQIENRKQKRADLIENGLKNSVPRFLQTNKLIRQLYYKRAERKLGPLHDSSKIPGRLISYIARKPK